MLADLMIFYAIIFYAMVSNRDRSSSASGADTVSGLFAIDVPVLEREDGQEQRHLPM
jgi:hypothetical protein